MNRDRLLKSLDALREAIIANDECSKTTVMSEHDRRVLGIQLRNGLRAVVPKTHAGLTVWVDEDGKSAVIADLPDNQPPRRTSVDGIRRRIAQGRHQ